MNPRTLRRMGWPSTARGRLQAGVGLTYLGLAAWEFTTSGVTAGMVGWLLMAPLFLAIGLRSDRAEKSPRWRERPPRGKAAYAALGALALVAWSGLFALDSITVRGTPLLAGPALRDVEVTTSHTAGHVVASPGRVFSLVEVTVASRLGAPLRHVYFGDFALEASAGTTEPAFAPTHALPNACDGFDVRPWRSRRCRIAFEVAAGTGTARLRLDESLRTARSVPLSLHGPPQADVPRVELEARVGVPLPHPYDPELVRVQLLVHATPVAGAAPVRLDRLALHGADDAWRAYDRNERTGATTPCATTIATERTTCVAEFDLPHHARAARLVSTTPEPLPGAHPSAGTIDVRF